MTAGDRPPDTAAVDVREEAGLAQRRARTVFDAIDEGYCLCEMILDGAGHPVDYRFLEVNGRFESMTGLAGATGRTALDLVPDLEAVWVETYARVGLGRETLRFSEASTAMGRWFDVFAVPVEPHGAFALVFRDQTERVRNEAALRESEERFRTMTNQLPLIVWQHDEHGEQVWVNDTFCSFFAVERDELVGGAWRLLTDPAEGTAYADAFADAVDRRVPFHAEVHVRRADGAWRWLESWAQPRFADDGAYVGHLGASADVTDRRQVEEMLRVGRARAELVAELLSELEREPSVAAQPERLLALLVPRLADFATVEAPSVPLPVVAVNHVDPAMVTPLRNLRERHRVPADQPHSVARAADGEAQLLQLDPEALGSDYALADGTVRLMQRLRPHSYMAVPLDLGGGVKGVLTVCRSDPARAPFAPDDLTFLQDVARRVGVVLAAARLRQEEHDIAVRLQRALLPDRLQWHPNVVIEARYHAADELLEVGGDWYDTYTWPDGRIAIVVGDVVGHNLDSAATMGRLRAAMAALAAHMEPSPAALLDALERCALGPGGCDFLTAVCVVVDPASGELRYSAAGHPPVIVVTPGEATVLLRDAQAPPLGVTRRTDLRPEASITLQPGAVVVLYSDGLVERRRERLDVGIDRLVDVMSALIDEPIDTVADRVIEQMAECSSPEDDVVVACFRFTPPTVELWERFPAGPEHLAGLRNAVRVWLAAHGVPAGVRGDVLLGIGEASTNAVEHAYQADAEGFIDVGVADHGHHLTALVRDGGSWRPPGRHSHIGGRGTMIMRRVTKRFERSSDAHGTSVTLTFPLPPPGRRNLETEEP